MLISSNPVVAEVQLHILANRGEYQASARQTTKPFYDRELAKLRQRINDASDEEMIDWLNEGEQE